MCGIFVVGYLFFIQPKYEPFRNQQQFDINVWQEAQTKLDMYYNRLKALEKDLNEIGTPRLQRVERMLPGEPRIERLMYILDTMVTNYAMKIAAISFNYSGDGVVSIRLTISGNNYAVFKDFLKELEEHDKVFDVQDMQFSLSGQFQLSINTYY